MIATDGSQATTEHEFTVIIERDEDEVYIAFCPALRGCHTEGDTEEEVREMIKDAIRLHIEARLALGEPIPQEVGLERVRVAV
ncbi:MAG: type II toxin-antitoxin system HicB family antitoxin [Chloroflexota bacterium]|nr:type II toxin-antitoxin system HicB family antitoxin [Chloroflexota bacterium]